MSYCEFMTILLQFYNLRKIGKTFEEVPTEDLQDTVRIDVQGLQVNNETVNDLQVGQIVEILCVYVL